MDNTFERICLICGETHTMELSEEDTKTYTDYVVHGKLIQDCFPKLNPMEREFIKTGYCPECQKALFGTNYTSEIIK